MREYLVLGYKVLRTGDCRCRHVRVLPFSRLPQCDIFSRPPPLALRAGRRFPVLHMCLSGLHIAVCVCGLRVRCRAACRVRGWASRVRHG
eukprot:4611195-Prymnesium_polylepis.1